MTDDLERRLRTSLSGAALPSAPDTLRDALDRLPDEAGPIGTGARAPAPGLGDAGAGRRRRGGAHRRVVARGSSWSCRANGVTAGLGIPRAVQQPDHGGLALGGRSGRHLPGRRTVGCRCIDAAALDRRWLELAPNHGPHLDRCRADRLRPGRRACLVRHGRARIDGQHRLIDRRHESRRPPHRGWRADVASQHDPGQLRQHEPGACLRRRTAWLPRRVRAAPERRHEHRRQHGRRRGDLVRGRDPPMARRDGHGQRCLDDLGGWAAECRRPVPAADPRCQPGRWSYVAGRRPAGPCGRRRSAVRLLPRGPAALHRSSQSGM